MSTPTTTVYVRPGAASYTWSYSGATVDSGAAVTAVSFDIGAAAGQALTRGDLQYSLDGGRSWTAYALPVDQAGTWLPAAGTLWRFVDRAAGDNITPGSFTVQMKLADNSVVALDAAVVVDLQPVGLLDDRGVVLSTLHAGETVATLTPIDTGAQTGGRWVIDSQSQPGLFAVGPVDADGAGTLVIANPAAMPAADMGVSVTMHYYDRYQLDANGNPIANTGVTDILTYTVVNGASADLAGFGADFKLGTATGAAAGQPALATLGDGGFVAAWQGPVQGGTGVWAQLRDAAGTARGAAIAIAADAGAVDGEPAVTALAGGRFVVAYSVNDGAAGHVAYRIVGADGSVGAEHLAGGAAPDAGMPALAALADGSFVLAWRSGGAVHTQQIDGGGAPLGTEHVVAALGSAFNPAVAALQGGNYVVSWGEIADGNVYTALGASGAPQLVTQDGAAASVTTAAPLAHVAALAGGGFVVAWDSYSNDQRAFAQSDIFFQRYDDAGNKLGDIVQANMDSGTGRYDAAVAALSDGGFVVTWQANADFDGSGVFGRRFGADGQSADLHEFEINQLRQGEQASPAVTGLANGGFVTAWVDTQDTAGASVEARVLTGGVGTAQSSTSQTGGFGATIGTPASSHLVTGAPAPASAVSGSATPVPTVTGSAADNAIALGSGSHLVDGGAGLDTVVLGGARAGYTLSHDAGGFTVADASGAHNLLANVERISFAGSAVALDISGVGGQAYRLYQAAFDRQPDQQGLGYWIKALDGGSTLAQVAAGFEGSKEFADLYGANPSDTQFTDLLYQNVLHRAPDAGGYAYWLAALGEQHLARTDMLVYFSESAENQAQVIGSIGNGIDFIPWA